MKTTIVPILRIKNAIEVLFTLRGNITLTKSDINERIVGDRNVRKSITDSCNALKKIELVTIEQQREIVPFQDHVTLTEEGEEIARKLSYVFDSEVEVFPVPKKQIEKLEKILEDQQEGSVENFILNSVLEKIKKHKVFK